jgi:hypothetical protein
MSKKTFPINFIITGGTIDSHYEGSVDTVIPRDKSIIPKYIKSLQLYQKLNFQKFV